MELKSQLPPSSKQKTEVHTTHESEKPIARFADPSKLTFRGKCRGPQKMARRGQQLARTNQKKKRPLRPILVSKQEKDYIQGLIRSTHSAPPQLKLLRNQITEASRHIQGAHELRSSIQQVTKLPRGYTADSKDNLWPKAEPGTSFASQEDPGTGL